MRKFTFFLAMLVAMVTTSMAQSYELTETRLTSSDLNSKTEPTLIAIKNLSKTNNYWFVGNTGAAPYSAANFTNEAVFVWEPVVEGVAGMYCLKKLDGTYMTSASPTTFSAENGSGAVFTTTNPTVANGQFNGDGDTQYDDESFFVRFVTGGKWINVQNGDAGTPVYNNGLGGWTLHNVYLVEEKDETVEPEPETPVEPAGPVVITSVDQLSNSKLYTITSSDAGRGNFYALDSKVDMCAVTYNAGSDACHSVAYNAEDPKQQFAFVAYEGKHYLYSVSEKKFIAKNGDVNQLTADAPYEFVAIEPVSENTFALMLNGTHYMTASPGWCANPSRGTCIQTTLTDHNSDNGWDAGAWYTITEVGTFDATEALAMLAPAEPEAVTFDIYALDDSMNPSPLEGTVSKLGFVVFAASDNNAVLAEAADAPKVCIFDPAMGGAVAEASGIMFGDLLGNGMQLVAVQFDGFSTPGTYMVYAPAGAFTVNGKPSEEIISAQFTIPAPVVKVFEVESVTPANNAEVEAIEKIEINFTENIMLQQDNRGSFYPVNLVDENNNVIELTTSDDANVWSKAVFTPAEPITAAGTYTLDLSQIKLDGGVCEGSLSWTIKATVVEPEPEATYYRIKTTTATGDAIYLNIGNTDEHQTGPKGGVNIVAYAEDDNQLFTIEEAGEGKIYLKSKSGYYIKGWAWNVDGSASQKSELEFEDAGEGTFYIKGENGYFKVEYVSDAYYPFCDAPISAAAKWTLEQVGAVEPELPALEITGYTPTEAVEKLETITITFNDEIEGTFDMMAMSQIYLGSRSNGCSFAVEGNVLTITPFNAITTPGEYGLVIPEGLITRKANGEKISLNKDIVFEVKAPLAALEITGYTPTEAVEKLETITITFNDEIEGTFDMMAMSQIYLGSRSNGCSFAVEGNVLTITPFNAITTPGEYGLVIPEGLITRKANGEKISLNKEIVFTVKEATVEPEPAATVAIYHITAKDTNRGALYATAESTHLTHCGATYGNYHNLDIAANAEDINQQFIFVEYEGKSYLYSLGAKKFAVKESQFIKLVENPEGFVTVVDTEVEGYKYIMFNGQNRLNFSGGYAHGCVANYETPDDGNHLALTEVGQYDATELVAYIEAYFKAEAEALAAARAAFDAKYAEAETILAEANLSVVDSELPLQVTDATAAAYIWSNKPEPQEGPLAQLVDGIAEEGNFFHTNWSDGNNQPRYHYIEVDLGEGNGLAEFSFKYTTRFAVQNDYPDAIQVLGSNDKEEYTEIYNVTSGLPQTGGTEWTSNIISSETAYRYLRFNVDAERTYWHMSEFDIVTSEITVAEKYAAVANSVVALDNAFKAAANNADYTAEELYAAAAAINAAIVEIYKDEATVALIATAKELIALEGIGYPAAAPRAELQAAIDAAVAMPDTENGTALQAAINAYYAATDIVLPEAGKAYTFKATYGDSKFYIYNNNGTLAVAACGDEELPESAKFICEYDSEDDFMFQFKTADGAYYLAYPTLGGKSWLDGESATGLEAESAQVTKFNINKILAGGEVKAQNNELLGLVELDGYRGYDNGKYTHAYGPIVVKHSALTFDGAAAPYYNENFTSAFCIEETEIVVEPLTVIAVTPSEAVESLQTITIEFDSEIAIDEANINACTIDYLGWNVIIGTTASVEGNVLKLVAYSPIKDKGTHYLTIPAGVVTRASDGVAYEGGKFEFEVKEKAVEPLTVVKVTPEAEVRTLDVITIEFSHNVFVNAMGTAVATIANADNSVKVTFSPMDIKCEGNIVTFDLGENAITVAGEYTLDIPSGIIARNDGVKYSGTHTFTVVALKTFAVNAYLFPTPQGDVTEIKAIRVDANQGASLSDIPTDWTFTNEEGKEFEMNIQWLNDFIDLFISFNPAITEAGTYTLTIPAGSLKTDDGKECEAATFQFTVVAPAVPLTIVSQTPAADEEVEKLETITVTFSENIEVTGIEATDLFPIYSENSTWPAAMANWSVYGDALILNLGSAITEAGTYSLKLPAEFFAGTESGAKMESDAVIYFTVNDTTGIEGVDAEGEQTIYDLTGRKIETITKGGIYIINGKKVVVK